MRLHTAFFSVVLILALPASVTAQQVNPAPSDSSAVVATAQAFFDAFDARDIGSIRAIFLPDTQVIHHNGVATNPDELYEVLGQTRNWWPRTRSLRAFEHYPRGEVYVLGFKNYVTFHPAGGDDVEESYHETWILERVEGTWRPVRIHYSRITADEHSEEVE